MKLFILNTGGTLSMVGDPPRPSDEAPQSFVTEVGYDLYTLSDQSGVTVVEDGFETVSEGSGDSTSPEITQRTTISRD